MSKRWKRGRYVGKYRLLKRIGRGGFADVYHARDTVQRIEVALKLPTTEKGDDLEDLEYEVRVASSLSHPNLLPVLNADYIEDALVVAYPLGNGSLVKRMKKTISTKDAIDITLQLLSGLKHAHQHEIVHCDVKPGNVICFPGNVVKLCDFGLCKHAEGSFKTSEPGGTLGYMAPELAMGFPSPRSDLFSVALIAWEMLTRKLPEWPYDWPPPRLESAQERSSAFVEVLRGALDPDARKRYPSAGAFLQALADNGIF